MTRNTVTVPSSIPLIPLTGDTVFSWRQHEQNCLTQNLGVVNAVYRLMGADLSLQQQQRHPGDAEGVSRIV